MSRDINSLNLSILKKYSGKEFKEIFIKKSKINKNKINKAKIIPKSKFNFKFKNIDEVSQTYVLVLNTQKI